MEDDDEEKEDAEEVRDECCSCGYVCFACLGMSWKDFM